MTTYSLSYFFFGQLQDTESNYRVHNINMKIMQFNFISFKLLHISKIMYKSNVKKNLVLVDPESLILLSKELTSIYNK